MVKAKRAACQGIKVDEHLLKQVDEFIDELYLGGGPDAEAGRWRQNLP